MNIKCFLFGHHEEEVLTGYNTSAMQCSRCGAVDDYYGGGEQWTEFEERGVFGTVRGWWFSLTLPIRNRFASRCWHCDKRLWLRRYNGTFCNEKCADQWIPF